MLLLLALLGPQDEEALRAGVPELVRRLADDDVAARAAARKALFALPLRLVPEVLRAGEAAADSEARAVLSEVRALSGWTGIFEGTIAEGRATILGLQDRRGTAWAQTQARILDGLSSRGPGEATAALEALLDSPHEGVRLFALAGLARFPPPSAARFLPLLKNPAAGPSAAEVILATGDRSVLPDLLELFIAGKEESRHAAQVLEEVGPGDAIARLAELAKTDEARGDQAVLILARAGPEAEGPLLGLFKVEHIDPYDLVEAIKKVGGPASVPAVRKYYEEDDDPDSRDDTLFLLRDPAWAVERLDQARREPETFSSIYPLRLASRGGPALRDRVLDWMEQPGLKTSVRKQLLPILGAVAREEDAPLLLEALKDARLREEAAEALDMIGHPAHAPALFQALLRSRSPKRLHRMVLGAPAQTLEDGLLEILEDPDGYDDLHQQTALALAARRLSPRLRGALLDLLAGERISSDDRAGRALSILCGRAGPEDLPRLATLRSSEEREVRAAGLLLALRAGDPSAAAPLAAILAEGRIGLREGYDPFPFLDAGAPAGKPWTEAVLAEWRKKPDWTEAACWLARRDVREVHARLRPLLDLKPDRERAPAEQALGACGVPEALEAITRRVLGGRVFRGASEEDEAVLVAASGRERRARILAAARSRARENESALRVAARMALPGGLALYREALRADQSEEDWEEDEDRVTSWCVEAVVRLKAREAVPDLRRLLRSRHPLNRSLAAGALAELADRGAVPLLVPLLDDPFEIRNGDSVDDDENFSPVRRVWHAALEALEKLTGTRADGASTAARRASMKAWYEKNRDAFR